MTAKLRRVRRIVRDNIATRSAPVYRYRVATPLTPVAVRLQLLDDACHIPQTERDDWLRSRRQPLDILLSEREAEALERWWTCEDWLAGNARVADFAGDRVQASRSNMTPLPDEVLPSLGRHRRIRRQLPPAWRSLLDVFCEQMRATPDAISPALAGCMFFPGARNKRRAYFEAIHGIATSLVAQKY